MKRIIKCSEISNKGRNWLASDEVTDLMKGCTPREKRLIGKIANSKNPFEYLGAVIDTVDVLVVDLSDSFSEFLNEALEIL